MQGPCGVTVDQDGYCLVGDQNKNALAFFIHTDILSTLYQLLAHAAYGITIDKEGFVYVVDYSNSSVYKF